MVMIRSVKIDSLFVTDQPGRQQTRHICSLESVQKKLNLTFVRCVRCSFGWGTRTGENKKLSLTFVQCSFGWRIRIGENKKLSLTFVRCSFGCTRRCGNAAFMLNRPVMGSISCRLYVYNTYMYMYTAVVLQL